MKLFDVYHNYSGAFLGKIEALNRHDAIVRYQEGTDFSLASLIAVPA
jgi:hypothetical protein